MIECNANLTFNHIRGIWPLIVDDRIELYAPDGSNPIFRLGRRRLFSLPIPLEQHSSFFFMRRFVLWSFHYSLCSY